MDKFPGKQGPLGEGRFSICIRKPIAWGRMVLVDTKVGVKY